MRNRALVFRRTVGGTGFALLGLLSVLPTAGQQTAPATTHKAPGLRSKHRPKSGDWREEWRRKWLAEHPMAKAASAASSQATPAAAPKTATSSAVKPAAAVLPPSVAPPAKSVSPLPAVPEAVKPVVPTVAPAPIQPVIPAFTSAPTTAKPIAGPTIQPTTVSPPVAAAKVQANSASVPMPSASGVAPLAAGNPLHDARPDLPPPSDVKTADKPLDSPLSAVGDGGKMLLYLAPVALLIVGGLRLLRGVQMRNGRLPGLLQKTAKKGNPERTANPKRGGVFEGLMGGFNLSRAREHGGSSIRVLESVPLGGAHLHLIEVRGKMLLLGATANGMNMLTEFHEQDSLENHAFRALLEEAATTMDSLELPGEEMPAPLLVGALDERMRDASSAVVRSARRLRTVQEAESAWMQE